MNLLLHLKFRLLLQAPSSNNIVSRMPPASASIMSHWTLSLAINKRSAMVHIQVQSNL